MLLLVFVLISASLLGCTYSDSISSQNNSENELLRGAPCTGDIGKVQNVFIDVTDREMIVTYNPPIGFENCDMQYDMVYYNPWYHAYYQQTVDKSLRHSYNYFEGRILCKVVNLKITPIYNGVRGQTYESLEVTDEMRSNNDVGPPRNIKAILEGDSLYVKWVFPTDYDNCVVFYHIETISINGEMLHTETNVNHQYRYNYALDGNYCKHVIVRVASDYNGVRGGVVFAPIQLGPPPNGSC